MSSTETSDTNTEPAKVEPVALGQAVVMGESKGHSKRRMILGLTIGVLFASAIIVAIAAYHSRPASACSVSFLKNAATHFDGPHRPQLIKDVAEIKSKKDYTKDPNCLYVVMEYNIHSSDSASADKTYAQLQKAYDPAKGFSRSLGPQRKTMAYFKASTIFLKRADVELKANSFGITKP
jgi:hypothetical protein